MNTNYLIIGILVVLVVILAVISAFTSRRGGSKRFRNYSGPEYERLVKETGSKQKARAIMDERWKRVQAMDIHPLTAEEQGQYKASWNDIQNKFIDQPGEATVEADALVTDVMKKRGYPEEDYEQRAADISVSYPDQVMEYRQAHEIAAKNEQHSANTEELRQEFISYRSLFNVLVEDGSVGQDRK